MAQGFKRMTAIPSFFRTKGPSSAPHRLEAELTDRLRTDPALLGFIQDTLLDGLWYWDLESDGEEWLSPGFKALFGYADDEIENSVRGWQALMHPDDVAQAMAAFERHRDTPGSVYDEPLRYIHRDGHTVWVRCRGIVLRDDRGKPVRMLGTHTDITDLKCAEADLTRTTLDLRAQIVELQDQEQRLEQQAEELVVLAEGLEEARADQEELNAQKDRFFSIIAHDLKSPFNPLLGFSELLASEGARLPPEKVAEYGALLHRAATEAFKLLEDLLDWSRIQLDRVTYDPCALDLRGLVRTNIDRYHYAALAKGVSLKTEGLEEGVFVYADPRMLDTVLRNLISNAIKFTRANDTITIIAAAPDNDGQAGEVRLSVHDTGVGIPADKLAALLDLDSTISAKGTHGETGTGMGLIISRELMDRQGGAISVESVEGEGTTFHLTLPRP
jgi:PAS domain S-box-containing protein